MSYPKIFIVNLRRSADRREHMERVLSPLPLEYEFIEAVDASMLTDEDLREIYNEEGRKKFTNIPLTKGEIACALSHIKIWKMMQRFDLKEALIMEDDVYIKDYKALLKCLAVRDQYPENYDIVFIWHRQLIPRGVPLLSFIISHEEII